MSPDDAEPLPELEVSTVFLWAGYDVLPAVGAEPGTVDLFAVPRTGLVRPKTYFTVWPTAPEDLHGAVEILEQRRMALGADQAMAIVTSGPAPAVSPHAGEHIQVLTLRRLVLELSGIADKVRRLVKLREIVGQSELFMPRKGKTSDGAIVDAVEVLVAWVNAGPTATFFVASEDELDLNAVSEELVYRTGQGFIDDPEAAGLLVTPLLIAVRAGLGGEAKLTQEAVRRRWVLQLLREREPGPSPCILALKAPVVLPASRSMVILRPSARDFEEWFGQQLGDAELHRALLMASRSNADFRSIFEFRSNHYALLAAVRRVGRASEGTSIQEWTARVIASFMVELKARLQSHIGNRAEIWELLPELAMEEFALGRVSPARASEVAAYFRYEQVRSQREIEGVQSWLRAKATTASSKRAQILGFSNGLIRDYFVAESLVVAFQAGNRQIMTRYQFSREYVLLFLAILSPDAAATATADRRQEARAEIEAEVERRLQLTLAHQLKRSVGAIRSDVKQIRKQWEAALTGGGPAPNGGVAEAFARIEQELAYQSSLAEQTRLWGEVPNGGGERLRLSALVGEVVHPLRGQFPSVHWEVSIAEHLATLASRAAVREILHCLIENAAHAAAFFEAAKVAPARVSIAAHELGDTVRIEVVDSGPGVHPDDRERIFDPYVTTKKGGPGRPLGTGLGLTIARRYAGHIGARVGLEADREATCFFATFVAHRTQPERDI